jgi:hypothetical protein
MSTFRIYSRRHGEVRFTIPTPDWTPHASGYVRVHGGDGYLGQQACVGGGCMGQTLTATPATLERVARHWWAARLRSERQAGM